MKAPQTDRHGGPANGLAGQPASQATQCFSHRHPGHNAKRAIPVGAQRRTGIQDLRDRHGRAAASRCPRFNGHCAYRSAATTLFLIRNPPADHSVGEAGAMILDHCDQSAVENRIPARPDPSAQDPSAHRFQSIQFSTRSPGTRLNSLRLLVTSTRPSALACPAIIMSYGPIGVPWAYNSART